MVELFRGTLMIVTREGDGRIYRVRRTARPTVNEVEFKALAVELARLLPSAQRAASLGLLLDMRDAPLLGDPVLEEAAIRSARDISAGFPRTAVLVRTAVGALQVKRIGRAVAPGETPLFHDEAEAFAFLHGTLAPPSAPVTSRRSGPTSR
jgi:hypothetical protein